MPITHQILFNSFDMTEIIESYDEGRPTRVNAQIVPKRHGAIISEAPVYAARQIRMQGTVYGDPGVADPVADCRSQLNDIQEACNNRRSKLYLFTDRFYNAYCTNFQYSYVKGSGLRVAMFSLDFVCDDPFAYSETDPADVVRTLTDADTPIDVTNGIYREEFTITNNGNIFIYPTITVQATGGALNNVVIRNLTTSHLQQYTGTILSGKSLVISNNGFTVLNDGESDLANFSGHFIWLDPGVNTMQIEGTVPATYTFDFKERFV